LEVVDGGVEAMCVGGEFGGGVGEEGGGKIVVSIELVQYHSPNYGTYVSSLLPVMLSPLSVTSHLVMR
jgi:hypothetical protein